MNKKNKNENVLKLSSFDFFIIILALCCIASIVLRAFVFNFGDDNTVSREYVITFKAENIRSSSLEYFRTGDTARIRSAGKIVGTVDQILNHTPSIGEYNDSGAVYYPEETGEGLLDDSRFDVTGTIIAVGNMTEKGFLLDSGEYIFAGSEMIIVTEHIEVGVKIMNIEEK